MRRSCFEISLNKLRSTPDAKPDTKEAGDKAPKNQVAQKKNNKVAEKKAKPKSTGVFLPPIARWIIGNPEFASNRDGILTLDAGENGNFIVTQKDNYLRSSITVELSADAGTEAFVARCA